jgi:hypothetical protein
MEYIGRYTRPSTSNVTDQLFFGPLFCPTAGLNVTKGPLPSQLQKFRVI